MITVKMVVCCSNPNSETRAGVSVVVSELTFQVRYNMVRTGRKILIGMPSFSQQVSAGEDRDLTFCPKISPERENLPFQRGNFHFPREFSEFTFALHQARRRQGPIRPC